MCASIPQTVDGHNVRGPALVADSDGEQYRRHRHRHRQEGFTWPRRTAVDVENMARDATQVWKLAPAKLKGGLMRRIWNI